MDDKKCSCNACKCSGKDIRPDGYCSDSCKNDKMAAGGKCPCGHSGCK